MSGRPGAANGRRAPGSFAELIGKPSQWLAGDGPHAELVLSTRVRLARNLHSVPFTHRARDEQLQGVLSSVATAAQRSEVFHDGLLLRMTEISALDRQILVERHMVSHELGDGARPRGIMIAPDERLSLMINEEDHLRLQAMTSGFQLAEAWTLADVADDELDQSLDFAFSDEIGYLTSCPTNTGTGLRASVLIHLPALVLLQEIQKVLKGRMARKFPLNVQMGLGHERYDDPTFPGKTNTCYAETAARGMYQRWIDMMTCDSWSEIEALREKRQAGRQVSR